MIKVEQIPIYAMKAAEMTATIVAQYASKDVASTAVVKLYTDLHEAILQTLQPKEPVVEGPKPAVPVRQSIKHDYIVCLEDGKKLKMLKRYLRTNHQMTPEQYREKWGLPSNYPMVAPAYAEQRRLIAHEVGLGKRPAPAAQTRVVRKRRAA